MDISGKKKLLWLATLGFWGCVSGPSQTGQLSASQAAETIMCINLAGPIEGNLAAVLGSRRGYIVDILTVRDFLAVDGRSWTDQANDPNSSLRGKARELCNVNRYGNVIVRAGYAGSPVVQNIPFNGDGEGLNVFASFFDKGLIPALEAECKGASWVFKLGNEPNIDAECGWDHAAARTNCAPQHYANVYRTVREASRRHGGRFRFITAGLSPGNADQYRIFGDAEYASAFFAASPGEMDGVALHAYGFIEGDLEASVQTFINSVNAQLAYVPAGLPVYFTEMNRYTKQSATEEQITARLLPRAYDFLQSLNDRGLANIKAGCWFSYAGGQVYQRDGQYNNDFLPYDLIKHPATMEAFVRRWTGTGATYTTLTVDCPVLNVDNCADPSYWQYRDVCPGVRVCQKDDKACWDAGWHAYDQSRCSAAFNPSQQPAQQCPRLEGVDNCADPAYWPYRNVCPGVRVCQKDDKACWDAGWNAYAQTGCRVRNF